MPGPSKIIDLDSIPVNKWRLDNNAVHLWNGKLWKKEPVGCALCIEKEGNQHVTFCHTDEEDSEHFHCMEHGELVEIQFTLKKVYTISIGDISREGEELTTDTILFPVNMPIDERNVLINKMLDDAERNEITDGENDEGPVDD